MTKIIVICGPTACGKSQAAIGLAQKIGGEVISADSMQIYKHMDIGTAKVKPHEMAGIRHYLIDELYPDEVYSAAVFKSRAKPLVSEITDRGKMPIICGGTGFYINALLFDTDFDTQDADKTYRAELEEAAKNHGSAHLHDILRSVDPESSLAIDTNNTKRIIRALEYYKINGRPISAHNKAQKQKKPAYDAKIFVLAKEREQIYDAIDRRVDKMAEAGLVSEVAGLLDMGYSASLTSMQGLGYKEVVKHLNNEYSLGEALALIKQGTRRFAKRQITWFKHQLPAAEWILDSASLTSAVADSLP